MIRFFKLLRSGKCFKVVLNERQMEMMTLELEKELGVEGGMIEVSYIDYINSEFPIDINLKEE